PVERLRCSQVRMHVEVLSVWNLPARHPQNPEALASSRCRQPGSDALGLFDAIEMLQEAKPCRLKDIGSVGGVESVPPCDSPNCRAESFDQGIPAVLVPVPRRPYEQGDGRAVNEIPTRRAPAHLVPRA